MTDLNDFTETTNLTPAADSAADSAANSANDSYTAPGRTPHAHKAKRNRRRNGSFHKRMLWKDIRVTMSKSKGRFASIVSLLTLGSFALVGLFVTGPDMQITGTDFFNQNNLADVTVISDYGLTKADENIIRSAPGVKDAEFGYFKDVTIKNSNHSLRVFSKPDSVSTFAVSEGRLPKAANEIALIRRSKTNTPSTAPSRSPSSRILPAIPY